MYDWKDINFDLLDIHLKVRQDLDEDEVWSESFEGCGEDKGVKVWRVDNYKLVLIPKELHGIFNSADSYLVLNSYTSSPKSEELLHNLHFWVGSECSAEEYCTAAYKAVELFVKLEGKPVQYREAEGYETEEFRKCFQSIGYGEKPRLWEFTRLQKDIAQMQRDPKWFNLHMRSVFVLEHKDGIVQWNAAETNNFERHRAQVFVSNLKIVEPKLHSESIEETDEVLTNGKFLDALGPLPEDFEIPDNKRTENFNTKKSVPNSPDYVKTLFRLTDADPETQSATESEQAEEKPKESEQPDKPEEEVQKEEDKDGEVEKSEEKPKEAKAETEESGKIEEVETTTEQDKQPEEVVKNSEEEGNHEDQEPLLSFEDTHEDPETKPVEGEEPALDQKVAEEPSAEIEQEKKDDEEDNAMEEAILGDVDGGQNEKSAPGESKEENAEQPAATQEDDEDDDDTPAKAPVVRVEVVAKGGDINGSLLDSDDVFMLDDINTCYVWLGSGSTRRERKKGFESAHEYLKDKPHFMAPVVIVNEGHETTAFKIAVGMA
ncbi:gelsolin-like protein 2 isoform X1 [Nematostella vectensis]|uniref:gelsolin-like protein 2 isoform X1 n=1 Tax=Nematostella vectensis TaxID=45351 RepID=UPI00207762B3|nr:gelsolin-like protein 2 isoform X1 [Nematostella vectensis]